MQGEVVDHEAQLGGQRFIHIPPKLGIPGGRAVVDLDGWGWGLSIEYLACCKKPQPAPQCWLGQSQGPNLQASAPGSSRARSFNSGAELMKVNDRQTTFL